MRPLRARSTALCPLLLAGARGAELRALLGLGVVLGSLLAACGPSPDPSRATREQPGTSASPQSVHVRDPERLDCRIGERPRYFVPGPPGSPLALLGCARLGVSGKRVDFSGNVDRIAHTRYACINPAYGGRGRRGIYIPAVCLNRPLQRFAVHQASQPQQAVRGYELVFWGTTRASTSEVVARYGDEPVRAAVFEVGPKLSSRFGERPFSLFVLELPLDAACTSVAVETDASARTERIRPQPKICERASRMLTPAAEVEARQDDAASTSAVTVRCEGITPKLRWRRRATITHGFGLLVKHLTSQSTELANGRYLVKAGAVVEGHEPVPLSVPRALRGKVGLVYGDASRGRGRRPSTASPQVTFEPCAGEPRSGYVGGLVFRGAPHAVRLEVRVAGAATFLRLEA